MAGSEVTTRPTAMPTVQLRHELPDGSSHFDWLLGQDPEGRSPLISFRLDTPVHSLREGQSAPATRIGDHRPAYLEYEGPVSRDRGTVTRLSRGHILAWRKPEEGRWELEIQWEEADETGNPQHLCLHRQDLDRWTVFLRTQTGSLR